MKRKRRMPASHSHKHKRLRKTGQAENLRTKIGLTQLEMAAYLGIKPGLYIMVENRQRSLPTEAILKYAELEKKFERASTTEKQRPGPHAAEHASSAACMHSSLKMQARELKCLDKSRRLGIELEEMNNRYTYTRTWLKAIETALEENEKTEKENDWWKDQHKAAIKRLNKCGIAAQLVLRSRIALLDAEAGMNKQIEEQLRMDLPEAFKEK